MIDDFNAPSGSVKDPLAEDKDSEVNQPEHSSPKPDLEIDEADLDNEDKPENTPKDSSDKKSSFKDKLKLDWPPGRKEWAIIALMLILLVGFFVLILSDHFKVIQPASIIKSTVKLPKSKLVPSTLSGLPVDPSINKIPVTGVMIENSDFARPQSGLSQASVVFEAIAEGGITRFLALYQDTSPDNVGPIRSVRPYYEQWALGFDASLAHVGGSPEALNDINSWNVKNLDQFYNSGSYHRISSRAAPHNVYTSIADLNQLEASKNYTTVNFSGFPRKSESPAKTVTAKSIDFSISSSDFSVHYDYQAATNSYNRVLAGAPHIDANTNKQISPKVVIAMVIPYSLESDGYHSDYAVIGSGAVYVFQDGSETTGTWTKTSSSSQIKFTDSSGKTIKLNPGQTWITAVSDTSKVSFSP